MNLRIEDLSVAYDGETVLNDLSFEVEKGEFISLLGPSGCGKSTLLKAVAGIVPQMGGRILIGDTDITNLPIHKRGTAVVFQDMRLFPHMNILENTAFPLKMQGVSKAERLKRARELLQLVQMEGFEHRLPNELSGGQQQRVALVRALAARPRLLLLDEPFSALDENLREDMRELVMKLHRQFDMTTILVTHDRGEALSMSHRVALMFEGRIIQCGAPQDVYARPASRQAADYFGNCVYISGRVEKGLFTAPGIAIPAEKEDGEYTIMLRPNCLDTQTPGGYILKVEAISYRGSDTQVTFRAEDNTQWKKSFAHTVPWKEGDILSAALTVAEPVLFENQ